MINLTESEIKFLSKTLVDESIKIAKLSKTKINNSINLKYKNNNQNYEIFLTNFFRKNNYFEKDKIFEFCALIFKMILKAQLFKFGTSKFAITYLKLILFLFEFDFNWTLDHSLKIENNIFCHEAKLSDKNLTFFANSSQFMIKSNELDNLLLIACKENLKNNWIELSNEEQKNILNEQILNLIKNNSISFSNKEIFLENNILAFNDRLNKLKNSENWIIFLNSLWILSTMS
ncbi:hypothetical protein [Mycoplasmopsis cricetuli]|uniref:hypothetical protein n=1 Tax=Mycoplasmopsis cricetuli TaxID=171283 RepID=UPI000471C36C|nr:hypothetical protein [Mycoplasmopsis cricetuli]